MEISSLAIKFIPSDYHGVKRLTKMTPGLIGFFFGVIVGGLGGILFIGLLFFFREQRKEKKNLIRKEGNETEEFCEIGSSLTISMVVKN